jgi:release factor glutamine methyltransferase
MPTVIGAGSSKRARSAAAVSGGSWRGIGGKQGAVRLVVLPGVFSPPSDAFMLAGVLERHAPGCDVLDVCAGSGVLAVVAGLAGARSVTAVDVSRRALATTWLNGRLNGVPVALRRGDLLEPVAGRRFDVIVSNPPYLPAPSDARPRGLDRATDAGLDGRRFLDRLLDGAPGHLRPGGVLLVVHSSVNGVAPSVERARGAGLDADVALRRHGPLGPILRARTPLLRERGLLAPGERAEDIVVIRGRATGRAHRATACYR